VSDDFLSRLREEPRAEFGARLEERLRQIDASERERRAAPRPWRRLAPALAGAGLVAALALAFSLEPVRAAAREFLDLFRVKRFAAVPVDPQRLERLAKGGLDFKSLVADQVQVLVAPQEPVEVASPEAGAVEAGIVAHLPAVLPRGAELAETKLVRPGSFRVQVDTSKLEALALAAGADEIEIPGWWNVATVDVEAPPVLSVRYARTIEREGQPPREESFVLSQSAAPHVDLPEGFDPAVLGRLALRLAGMGAEDALAFSRSIDWRATLLVPVPVQGGSFREVEVSGQPGLLVTVQPPPHAAPAGSAGRARSLVLWSAEGQVFALQGPASRDGVEILEMAQSVTDQSRGRVASE
jgi:hypothetical protein